MDFIYGEKLKFDAREYLEKFIQLRFDLPPLFIEDVKKFIKNNLPKTFIDEYIDIIAEGIKKNPRNIKLFINNMKLQLMLSKYQDFEVNIPLLVEWVVIRHSFPDFAKEIEDNPPILLKYHDEKIIENYKNLKEEDKATFINSEGMKDEFIKNDKLIKFLKANKQEFDSSDVRKVILQTKLTPSITEESFTEKANKIELILKDFNSTYLEPIVELKNEIEILSSKGVPEYALRPLIGFFEYFDRYHSITVSEISKSKNENEVIGILNIFVKQVERNLIKTLKKLSIIDRNKIEKDELLTLFMHIIDNTNRIKEVYSSGDILKKESFTEIFY